jgi:hypothetical protein
VHFYKQEVRAMTKKQKYRGGRKPLVEGETQAQTISFRTTGVIKASIQKQAEKEEVTMGEIMRRLVIQGVPDVD